jgi:RNA polymerase sigma factor (sigma-70 family)
MSASESGTPPHIELLYASHHSWLQRWLFKKMGNDADAADLAQDTFTRILSGRQHVTITEPRAYLTTIAKSLLINKYQRQALERAYLDALAHLPEPEHPSPEHRYLILETLHEIDAMLDRLPAQVREAFLLSQLEGLTYDDIARQMNVAVITIKRYMKQAFLACLLYLD